MRISLPKRGKYEIRLKAGHPTERQHQDIEFLDDSEVFSVVADNLFVGANVYVDAVGVCYGDVDWEEKNTPLVHHFKSAVFRVRLGALSSIELSSAVSYVSVETPDSPLRNVVTSIGVG